MDIEDNKMIHIISSINSSVINFIESILFTIFDKLEKENKEMLKLLNIERLNLFSEKCLDDSTNNEMYKSIIEHVDKSQNIWFLA